MGLITPDDVIEYAGIEDEGDAEQLLQRLIDQVEAVFLGQCNRTDRPFQGEQQGRIEILDGTGRTKLMLAYPIKTVTAITLGRVSPYDETLNPADPLVISYQVGGSRLSRVDGGTWGCLGSPDYIRVTYDTQADEPEDVKAALIRTVAAIYRETGRHEARNDRVQPDSADLPIPADADPYWQAAISAHWEPRI